MAKPKKSTYSSTRQDANLLKVAAGKHATLPHLDEHGAECSCGGKGVNYAPEVDLIVLIDTSQSMSNEGKLVSEAADAAINKIAKKCQTDLKVIWLGIQGGFAGTNFQETARNYLQAHGCPSDNASVTNSPGALVGYLEEGADTISDLSLCSKIWRRDACRAIFYISDEALDQGDPQNSSDDQATALAISNALANKVEVYTHLAPGYQASSDPDTIANFTNLSEKTGGKAYIGGNPTQAFYETILEEVICTACRGCQSVELPELAPCLSIHWADSDCDCFESDDFETLYIKATNCYDNVDFCNLVVGEITVTDHHGKKVKNLPDGTPAITVVPAGPICFGDLPRCREDRPVSKVREFAIRTRGVKAGDYQLHLSGVCFQLLSDQCSEDSFALKICQD